MKPYWKVTLWYMGFSFVWIFLSDKAIALLTKDIQDLTFFQTMKGGFFVLISGWLIFCLTKRAFNDSLASDREKHSIFKKTVAGVYHILLNYLNQMQLVTMEAEKSKDFDRQILLLSKDISYTALKELRKLDDIESLTSDNIDSVVYHDSDR